MLPNKKLWYQDIKQHISNYLYKKKTYIKPFKIVQHASIFKKVKFKFNLLHEHDLKVREITF